MKKNIYPILIILFCITAFSACKTISSQQQKMKDTASSSPSKLNGNWQLNYISGIRIAFEGLYPETKPSLSFNAASGELNGNTSCNVFGSKTTIDGNNISIAEPSAMTMRFCEGEGQQRFLDMLKKVNRYDVNDSTLTLIQGDIAVMRFTKN